MTTLAPPNPETLVDVPRPGSWAIEWRGRTVTEADISGQHLSVLSMISGTDDFASLDVDPRHGHQRLMLMIAAIDVVAAVNEMGDDVSDEDAVANVVAASVAAVSKASADEILGALRFEA